MKGNINRLADHASLLLVDHLTKDAHHVETYAIEIDIVEKLKRIYYFSKRIAKTVLPRELINNNR